MLRTIYTTVLILIVTFLNVQSVISANGSISANAAKVTLIIHEETTGTISITLPDKPQDTDEIHYLGSVTAGTPSVSGVYTPSPTTENPNPSSSAESGVTILSSSSFKFSGNKAGTWKEKFTVSFSSLSTEVYDPATDSWVAGDPYSFSDTETSIIFTVTLCEKKCSGGAVAVIPLGYDFNTDPKGIKAMFNSKIHHCTTGTHSCHKVNFSNVNVSEAGKYVIHCLFDTGTSQNHGCNPADCPNLGEIWVVRIRGMEYKIGSGDWTAVGSMKVPVESDVNFRVLRNPTDSPSWPSLKTSEKRL